MASCSKGWGCYPKRVVANAHELSSDKKLTGVSKAKDTDMT
jgi:hypothetical protein